MRVVFLGTPEFAVPSLQALYDKGWDIPLVVTPMDKPKGRGKKLAAVAVKTAAIELGLPVLQVDSVRTDDFLERLTALKPDFLAVVAFGRILDAAVLSVPRYMPVNVHPSILPKYRGPAPIPWAILHGDKETGVCTMRLDAGVDSGDVLLVAREPIHETDTAKTLHDRLARIGGTLLAETLEKVVQGEIEPVPQDDSLAIPAPMLKKQDGRMDWTRSATDLVCLVRAMDPWPGAFTYLDGRRTRIFHVKEKNESTSSAPGTVLSGTGKSFLVATGDGVLDILELQSASGKRLKAADYLRGKPILPGTILE